MFASISSPGCRRPMMPLGGSVLGEQASGRTPIAIVCSRQHVVGRHCVRSLSHGTGCSTTLRWQGDSGLQDCLRGAAKRGPFLPGWQALPAMPRNRGTVMKSTQQETVSAPSEETPPTPSASSPEQPPAPAEPPKEGGLQRTMADLDALLGIVEETSKDSPPGTSLSISSEAVKKLAEAEASRLSSDASQTGPLKDKLEGQMQKIIERARKLAETNDPSKGPSELDQRQLRLNFESLLRTLSKNEPVSKEDIKKLRETVFGPMTFWVTETVPLLETERVGVTIRGNLRDDRNKVFDLLNTKLEELFPGKYEALMVEDLEAELEEGGAEPINKTPNVSGPRVAFQIIPAAQAVPPQQTGWKAVVALVTSLFLVATCIQLALVANISKLPKETLDYFANPDSYPQLAEGALPPGLENWDVDTYLATAIPIATCLLGVNAMHELGHRIAGFMRKVKLGPSFFIPNLDIGSFGAITPFASLLKGRADMWDVTAAGPFAGMMMSVSLLLLGYMQSHGDYPKDLLVTVPSALFQGSLLLGSVTRMALGDDVLRAAEVTLSPLVLAGWCGVVVNSLQLLPVGSLDGGRMVQAAFGNQALALTSFFSYLGLGLGLLGSNLSLPFGLYVIICQREAETYIKDSVSPISEPKRAATLLVVLTALLVLLPMAPEIAESFGVGNNNPFV